mgnify:CR=1 FL=1
MDGPWSRRSGGRCVAGAPEVAAFLAHLAERRKVSASTQTQALAALLFLYRRVLEREIGWVEGLRARAPVQHPGFR